MADDEIDTLPADDSDIKRMTFEEALAALERIVGDLDKVEKIKLNRAGKPPGPEPLDPD